MNVRPELVVLAILAGLLPVTVSNVIDTAPVAYLPGVQTAWEQRAEDMGVEVVVTDDDRNCGGVLNGAGLGGGCHDPATPDRIYVGAWMDAATLERVALHELAHAWYFRAGIGGSECMADRLAAKWGAAGPFTYCEPV